MKKDINARMGHKKKPKTGFPVGWDAKRVQKVIDYYENQSEEDALAEDEAARIQTKGRRGAKPERLAETQKTQMPSTSAIAHMVHWIRHEKVMLDEDLAQLYGVTTGALNQAVKRNLDRFPDDFVFQLTAEEYHALRSQNVTLDIDEELGGLKSQIVISNTKAAQNQSSKLSQNVTSSRGGRKRSLPYAFTEQGVAMLSSVLRSPRAVEVNIAIMRTFVQLRRLMDSNRDLERKIETLEKKYDEQFAAIFHAIKQLIRREPESPPPSQPKRRIGYKTEESKL